VLYYVHHKKKIKQNSGNSHFSPHKYTLPFPSSHNLATQAAADLTQALLNPHPEGPLCRVSDEQATALKRLANIFVSATPINPNNSLAPQDEVENNAPRRVKNTVSPPRVASQYQQQMSLQHIIPSQIKHQSRIAGNKHLSDE
jgi:hypothetical protein